MSKLFNVSEHCRLSLTSHGLQQPRHALMTLSLSMSTRLCTYMAMVSFLPGIATLCGHTSKLSEMNVATRDTNLWVSKNSTVSNISDFASTGTGSQIPITSTNHLSLTGVIPAWVATEHTSHTTEV